jgi:anti-sigma B factor antagonist
MATNPSLFQVSRAKMPRMQPRSLAIEDVPGFENGPHIFRLSGPLLLTTLAEFQTRVREDRSHNLIFDFTNVPYLDSAGIGTLVGIYVRHQRDENGVSLVGVNDRVRAALELSHVDQFFRFFGSLSEAQAKRL